MAGKIMIHGFQKKMPDAAKIIINSREAARVATGQTVTLDLDGDSTISAKYSFLATKESIKVKDGENIELQLVFKKGLLVNQILMEIVSGNYTTTTEKQQIIKFEPLPGSVYALNGGVGDRLHVFEDRVVIQHKGVLNFFAMGIKGDKTLYYSDITSVQFKKPGITAGHIQFSIPGGVESSGGVMDASRDENTITFNGSAEIIAYAEEMVKYIDAKISEYKRAKGGATIVQAPSKADELKKYKELLDIGAITQEEFDAKKKELLGL
ncbi:MAG: SHOCT domain-containing protein [Clostridia bacterium]|nr:SHOCT domain-containing protein [Clostridia bacterium]MBR7111952.1 SHOCT domain-containing protein [Clostridia bacterium]